MSTVAQRSVQQDLQSFFLKREGMGIIVAVTAIADQSPGKGVQPYGQKPSAVYKIHWQPLLFVFHRHSTELLDNNRNIYIFLNNFKR